MPVVDKETGKARWRGALQTLWFLAPIPFVAGSVLILAVHLFVFPVRLVIGQVVPYNVVSPMDAIYVNTEELQKLDREGKTYVIDPKVEEEALLNLRKFFVEIRSAPIAEDSPLELARSIAEEFNVPREAVAVLLTFDEESLVEVESYSTEILSAIMGTVVDGERLNAFKRSVLDNPSATLPETVAHSFLRVNIKESADPMELREHITRLVSKPIRRGEVILPEGGIVTQLALDKLSAVRVGFERQNIFTFAGLVILLLAISLIWLIHAHLFKRHLISNPLLWFQMSAILIISLALSMLIGRLPFKYVYYAIPVGVSLAVIIIVTVYDAIIGLYIGIGLSIIVALALGVNANLATYFLLSCVYPVVFLGRKTDARRLVLFGVNLGIFNTVLALVVILVSVQAFSWWALLYSFSAGIGASILALGLTPVVEIVSTQGTRGKLASLLNQEHPLLKRLLLEAPGTYFHSLVMASMAEEASTLIGADALLAKVGAMYHDIGKLKRPGFFAENISDQSKNPHQNLPPESSYQIVVHHVTEGMDLGRKHGLPPEVVAFIPEHHGRDVVKYFYEEALKRKDQGAQMDISPEDFMYPGPNPRSKETAIVMLADSCEAIVRSMESFDEEEVKRVVRRVIDEKLSQGLLDDSSLTLGDANKIVDAFASVLVNLHHSRLKYPERNVELAEA